MNYEGLLKEDIVIKEIKRLNAIFAKLEAKTKKAVQTLIESAAFMSVTLRDLENTMNKNGIVSEYQNGENQWGTKKSPEVEIYNTMVKNHASIIKQLTDLLPKGDNSAGDDELIKFLKR